MIRQVLPAFAALAIVLAALPAAAQDDEPLVRTTRVAYGDLDLAKPEDARKLMARLHSAASQMCEMPGAFSPLLGYAQRGRCITASLAAAVREVNSPLVTALHTGKPVAAPVTLAAR